YSLIAIEKGCGNHSATDEFASYNSMDDCAQNNGEMCNATRYDTRKNNEIASVGFVPVGALPDIHDQGDRKLGRVLHDVANGLAGLLGQRLCHLENQLVMDLHDKVNI